MKQRCARVRTGLALDRTAAGALTESPILWMLRIRCVPRGVAGRKYENVGASARRVYGGAGGVGRGGSRCTTLVLFGSSYVTDMLLAAPRARYTSRPSSDHRSDLPQQNERLRRVVHCWRDEPDAGLHQGTRRSTNPRLSYAAHLSHATQPCVTARLHARVLLL